MPKRGKKELKTESYIHYLDTDEIVPCVPTPELSRELNRRAIEGFYNYTELLKSKGELRDL